MILRAGRSNIFFAFSLVGFASMAFGTARVDGRRACSSSSSISCAAREEINPRIDHVGPHAIDAISTQVHARAPDGVARGGGLHALVQVLL